MKRLKVLLLAASAFCCLLIAGSSPAYDKAKFGEGHRLDPNAYTIPVPEDIDDSYVLVRTRGVAEVEYERLDKDFNRTGEMIRTDGAFVMQGSGTVIKPGFVITAAHVVYPTDGIWVAAGQKRVVLCEPINIYMRFVMLLDKREDPVAIGWVYHLDLERDIAIVRYVPHPDCPLKPIPFKFGTQDKLEWQDALAFIQHGHTPVDGCDPNFVWKMAGGEFTEIDGYVAVAKWSNWKKDAIAANMSGRSGDSGSLVYAFEDGKPVIIGVLYGGQWGMTIIASIDSIVQIIQEG